jgi:LCP family protein required for cell wall assembly
MSRYEDAEGTGGLLGAGKKRLGSLIRPKDRGGNGDWAKESQDAGTRRLPGRLGASGGGPGSGAVSRTQRILGRHPLLSILGILMALTLTFISLTAYAAYRNVYDSIHHVTVTSHQLGKRPPKLDGGTNILIVGSDSRAGTHGKFGRGIGGSRSDTSMLLHIPPDHSGALVVSMPRDTMVPIFQCDADGSGHPGQQAQPGSVEQLNWTYSFGGAPCLWKTLEQVTRIHIDHFVEVNFLSFRQIVNDIGGVPVCLPYAIKDPASRLNLPAGRSVVRGSQALAFVRERHIGEGSDLQRINRQQVFLASLAQKIKSESSSLSSPTKLYGLAHDVAGALTTDMNFNDLYAVANSLRGLSTGSLQFITAPVAPYPGNPANQVVFWQPYANKLFRAVARDNHLEKTARRDARTGSQPVATVSTHKVQVQVLNGTNASGLAATTASQLTTKGFRVAGKGNASISGSTVIEYGSARLIPEANTLQKEIPAAQLKLVSSIKGTTLNLVLGSNFKGLASAHKAKHSGQSVSKVVKSIGNSTASNGYTGSTNICHDQSAFTGPDTPSMFSNG